MDHCSPNDDAPMVAKSHKAEKPSRVLIDCGPGTYNSDIAPQCITSETDGPYSVISYILGEILRSHMLLKRTDEKMSVRMSKDVIDVKWLVHQVKELSELEISEQLDKKIKQIKEDMGSIPVLVPRAIPHELKGDTIKLAYPIEEVDCYWILPLQRDSKHSITL